MSDRGRGGSNPILDSMCDSALSDIRKENNMLKRRVRTLEKTVESKDKTIEELRNLQVVKDTAIDRLSQLCKDGNDQIIGLETEIETIVSQLSEYLERVRKRQKKQRTTSESGETTK